MRSILAALIVALCCAAAPAWADGPSIHGRVLDPSGLPLPGVTITARGADGATGSAVSGEDGAYAIDLPPGRYEIEAALDAFEPAHQHDVELPAAGVTLDLHLSLATMQQEITVSAPSAIDLLGTAQPDAPVSVTREVMDVAMLPNSQYDDVLPLMPNVVRGPDGLIAVAGARATAGGLYVNGLNASDPLAGGAGIMLPLDAVDTMQVYAGGAPAEFGRASGGVTTVQTRAGTDRFRMSLDSFFPRLLYSDGGLRGVAFWDPNLGFSGPLRKGRSTYQQALSYRYDRNSYTTLAGDDHNLFTALLSWTQIDTRVTDTQRVRLTFSADPREVDHANVTAFTPSASAPRLQQGGWSSGVASTLTAHGVLLEFRASALRTQASVTPSGHAPYVVSHALVTGSYFEEQDREAQRLESGARLTWSIGRSHLLTTGATIEHASLDQSFTSAPITMLRSDGSVAQRVTFSTTAPTVASSTSVGLFVQDRWTPRAWLTIDAGVRSDETTTVGDPPVSPRVGWTLGSATGRTTFSGSVGLFSDILPLDAQGFTQLPVRTLVSVDALGSAAPPVVIGNTIAGPLHVPQAVHWDAELDRRVNIWTLRLRYEERRGTHELIVAPPGSTGDAVTPIADMLSSSGASHSRSLETTAGVRAAGGTEAYVSYVRSRSWGSQNSLDQTEGLMRVPFVQANLSGPLPIDVPHRLLAWGVFHLPARFTVAPFLDARSGFPYTALDDGWMMASMPGQYRLPWTASVDLSATKIVGLPRHLPEARVGVKLYNIVSTNTEREVQRDIARADFGTRYDPVPRDFSLVFEFLWGRHR
jgi:hypothetical protein